MDPRIPLHSPIHNQKRTRPLMGRLLPFRNSITPNPIRIQILNPNNQTRFQKTLPIRFPNPCNPRTSLLLRRRPSLRRIRTTSNRKHRPSNVRTNCRSILLQNLIKRRRAKVLRPIQHKTRSIRISRKSPPRTFTPIPPFQIHLPPFLSSNVSNVPSKF